MKLEDIFTAEELALIDSGEYKPGRASLDAKLDLCAAIEREACSKVCERYWSSSLGSHGTAIAIAAAIRARGQA